MKNRDKSTEYARIEYEKAAERIRLATPATIGEDERAKQKRIQKLVNDPKLFQEYYLPDLQETPKYLIKAAKMLLKNPKLKVWWKMFRGARKSTWLGTIIPMMLIAKGEISFGVIIGPSEDFSERMLANLQAQLENNGRFIQDFGTQVSRGSWESGFFTTADNITFIGLGIGQPTRGLNVALKRPDYVVVSDVDSKEYEKNPARAKEMSKWVTSDVMGTREAGGKRFRFILDNNHAFKKGFCTRLTQDMPSIVEYRVDLTDANGKPVADFIDAEFMAEVNELPYASRQGEYWNNPITEGNIFKNEWIVSKTPYKLSDYEYIVSYTDASFTSHKKSDYKAIVFVGYKAGEYHILKSFCRQCSLSEMVEWHYAAAKELRQLGIHAYHYVEGGFVQELMIDVVYNEVEERNGWYMNAVFDKRRKGDKHDRIEGISPKFEKRKVFFSVELKEDKDTLDGIDQILAFERGSRAHDDYPDALHGAIYMLEEKTLNSFSNEKTKPKFWKRKTKTYL